MTEPKNEPVRIALPSQPEKASPSGNGAEHPLVRIVLPTRTPVAPVRRAPPKITVPPHSTPKNETARISELAPPPALPIAKGAQPLPVVAVSSPLDGFDAIPPIFRWVLFGIASTNFLIQIWIYVVS